jgi:hypothetical protein
MSDDLFYHPDVLRMTRAIFVSRGVRSEADLEDATHGVVLECLEHVRRTGRSPGTGPEAKAIARPVAQNNSVDELKKRARRGKHEVGLTEDPDAYPQQTEARPDLDQQRMFAAAWSSLSDAERADLLDAGADVSQAELAAEKGIAPTAQRKRMQKARAKALRAIGAKGYLVAGGFVALLGVAFFFVRSRPEPGGVGQPTAHADASVQGESGRELRPSSNLAAEQRRVAARACAERNWDACESALDRAAQLDPEVRGPEESALRAAIASGRRADRRPGR